MIGEITSAQIVHIYEKEVSNLKSLKQMLRRPVKLVSGLLLMTMAAAILCVCVGQAYAAKSTENMLDRQFTTIALPAGKAEVDNLNILVTNVSMPEDLRAWLEEMVQSNPDVLKEVYHHGILSAHIPELTPLNYTQGKYIADNFSAEKPFWFFQPQPDGVPYSCAMLVITLDEISEPAMQTESFIKGKPMQIRDFSSVDEYLAWYHAQEKETLTTGYSLSLTGTVTDVVSLQEGFRDPTGMIARLNITVPSMEELDALNLVPGQRYIVYGMDYYDEDWALRGLLADDRQSVPVQIDAFDLSRLYMLTEEELELYSDWHPSLVPAARYGSINLTQLQYDQINAISMTLNTPVSLLAYEDVRDENGNLLEVRVNTSVSYTDSSGETVACTTEEYAQRYMIPTIARLDGSVEEFLKSADGALWQEALERDAVNNHAFAVVGVDSMGYLADFAKENSRITQGRDFTEGELSNGSRVCIIHETLAAASGLKVGDTITLNLYRGDLGLPYQSFKGDKRGLLTPSADFYFDTTTITETAVYTIVGCCRGQDLWVDVSENEYGFSPNTIFVPKASVETEMEYADSILLVTPVIYNGKLEVFRTLAAKADFEDRFVYYDQGYSTIASNFHNYEDLARQVLAVGLSVYLVLLFLFLLLYPGSEKQNVIAMRSLGASFGKRLCHVMASSGIIIVPAAVLGGAMGLLLWKNVVNALQSSAEAALALQIEPAVLVMVAAAQLLLAVVVSFCVALFVAAQKGLAKRR